MSNFKILLISDSALNINGGGISQTLANIFVNFSKENLLVVSALEELKLGKSHQNFNNRTISFKRNFLPQLRNRLGLYLNKHLQKLSFYLFLKSSVPGLNRILAFNPHFVIICAQGKEGIVIGEKLNKILKKPFCVYFMDDWFANQDFKWPGGDIQSSIRSLLCNANGWIMISKYLAETISERFKIKDKPVLVLHNPVDPWENNSSNEPQENELELAYAGALWPMHIDACILIAKALKAMNDIGVKGQLTLYCRDQFWTSNRNYFDGLPVKFGGFLSYHDLYPELAKHKYALVCSSFDEENKFLTASSVQTKITDYMNAERVIISIGPSFGACNRFIEENEIGYTIDKLDVEQIKENLLLILHDNEGNKNKVAKAKSLIKDHFNKQAIVDKLNDFIKKLIIETN